MNPKAAIAPSLLPVIMYGLNGSIREHKYLQFSMIFSVPLTDFGRVMLYIPKRLLFKESTGTAKKVENAMIIVSLRKGE